MVSLVYISWNTLLGWKSTSLFYLDTTFRAGSDGQSITTQSTLNIKLFMCMWVYRNLVFSFNNCQIKPLGRTTDKWERIHTVARNKLFNMTSHLNHSKQNWAMLRTEHTKTLLFWPNSSISDSSVQNTLCQKGCFVLFCFFAHMHTGKR